MPQFRLIADAKLTPRQACKAHARQKPERKTLATKHRGRPKGKHYKQQVSNFPSTKQCVIARKYHERGSDLTRFLA